MKHLLVKNGRVYYQNQFQFVDIYIEDGMIKKIGQDLNIEADIIDATGLIVVPGFVDMHVHLREPGFEYKETIKSGSLAALHGGYTDIVAMANTSPCMDNVETVEDFRQRVLKDSYIHTYTYAALTTNLQGDEMVDLNELSKQSIVKGFSDDGRGVQSKSMMEVLMKEVAALDSMIVAHCEDENELRPGGCIHEGLKSSQLNVFGINSPSEYKQVQRDIELAKINHTRYHVCHVSTKESVEAIKQAKLVGYPITAEVTPHHLLLTEDDVIEDGNYKMNPPLRTKADQKALIEGLKNGVIDAIATDHAPHSLEEKNKGLAQSMFGIIGSEFAFSLLYTYLVKKGIISLEQLVESMSLKPASILRIEHGIEENKNVALTLIDLEKTYQINESQLHSLSTNTPFLNQIVEGQVKMVLLNQKIYRLPMEITHE